MVINETKLLSNNHYFEIESIKKQIVFGNTFNHDMKHVIGWLHRYNGNYKKTAAFTIGNDGEIYKHFDPKYQSEYFNDLELNNKSIVILLENDGWLIKNERENKFLSWLGYIYNEEEVVNKKWRGYNHWLRYNDNQIKSAIELSNMLCQEFFIPLTAITHNTKIEALEDYTGILYKSNLEKHYTDLTPAFDFDYFTNNINIK